MDCGHRAGIAAQALEVIERQPEEVRDRQLDRIGMEHHHNNVLGFVVLPDDRLQGIGDAGLHIQKRLPIRECEA